MKALLRLLESPDSDDDGQGKLRHHYRPDGKTLIRLRCFACAGSGKLRVVDRDHPKGRNMRCVVCRGSGRVRLR